SICGLGDAGPFQPAFDGLCRDMNTPDALGKTFTAIKGITVDQLSVETAATFYQQFHFILAALGLILPRKEETTEDDVPSDIRALAEERWTARQNKDWAASDTLRDQLADAGWLVKDGKEGYTVTPKS
ncbi:MAG: cysteinyl-tRNA synthetase, partial [Verrucomicrobiales bacterium]